ncbi:MAG: cytochrome c3 family protein, partial [Thermoanaerobaculia bacterium]
MKLGRFTVAGYAIGLILGIGIVATYGAMHMSSTPSFCGSCHVMSPYYESWAESSHANINCVDCHISPGITQELRKKYEAMAMVARYFTGTYGTNPWAEVDDSACLECHERRLLMGREVFGDVLFDHGPHLSELRRGKRLKCTSCHSQIVQGSHMTVTATTCTLCHFKGQQPGEGTARCTLCHQVPDRVLSAGGLDFDHGDVARFGMECNTCHTPPDPNAGRVPKERCLTCHNEPSRLAEYEKGDQLHQTHVTDHKVECTHCHLEIEHVAPRHLEAAQSECGSCHGGGHSPQRDLYAGLGGKGVDPRPDVMYLAGVRCEGCHLDHGSGETALAGEISCMSCHGPKYRQIFENWQATIAERASGMRRQIDSTARLLGSE